MTRTAEATRTDCRNGATNAGDHATAAAARPSPRPAPSRTAEQRTLMLSHVNSVADRLCKVRQIAWAIDQLTLYVQDRGGDNLDLGDCVQHLGVLAGEQADLAKSALDELEGALRTGEV